MREKTIKRIGKLAGKELMKFFKKDKKLINVRLSSKEVVTKYDKLIDQLIIKEIKKSYPKDNILTEESGFLKGDSNFLWIVDSLDGSGNFANQNPLFSVCLCLLKDNEPFLGVIYAPAIDEFYFVEKGKGSFLNSKKINVSNVQELNSSYVFYCEGSEKNRNKTKKILTDLYPKVRDIRKIGSAGIEISWVASGKGDAFWTSKIDPWDVAAGVLLIKEAGGQVTDFNKKDWVIKRTNLLFSNSKIHNQILKIDAFKNKKRIKRKIKS